MCSILAILDIPSVTDELREQALTMSRRQRHRGPDWSGIHADDHAILAHERLAIVDLLHGAQPLYSPDQRYVLAVNGEIYNHRELRKEFPDYTFQTDSDCEVIIPLLDRDGIDGLKRLNGIYAFVLWDSLKNRFLVARDPVGVIPLYFGHDAAGHLIVASEMKALEPVCNRFEEFLPGHVLDSDSDREPREWHDWGWEAYEDVEAGSSDPQVVRNALSDAVHRQLMGDVPYGVLLSGGLDSSVIAALACKYAASRVDADDQSEAWWPRIHSFAIGLEGSPDLAAAKAVADHI
ncbi:MAG: asparagine synthase-related protein, partial [Rhodothermales bacterium]